MNVPAQLSTLLPLCCMLLMIPPITTAAAPRTEDQPAAVSTGPVTEPPDRARVLLDGVPYDVPLGLTRTLPNGRELEVTLLNTREFSVPGAFSFDYPRSWSFLGAVGVPTPVDSWWTLNGQGEALYLRRHAGDADALVAEYVRNLARTQAGPDHGGEGPRDVTLLLGGRELKGQACTYTVGSIGLGETLRWEQQVFGWQERAGVAWLLTIQRTLGTSSPGSPGVTALEPVPLRIFGQDGIGSDVLAWGAGSKASTPDHSGLHACLASFRWE